MPRPITLKIKRMEDAADLPLPVKMTEHAAGFDLPAAVKEPTTLRPGEIRMIPCGFCMAVPHGYEAEIRPRSGLASKHGITMINTPGTIDSDYRGTGLRAADQPRPRSLRHRARHAHRADCSSSPFPAVELVEVDELDDTQRGQGGFGHTGH